MNVTWFPNRRATIALLIGTSLLLVWGTALNGRQFGPIRALLRALPHGDKVGHFGLYGTITLAAASLVRTRTQAIGAALAIILVGIGDEYRQLSEGGRNFSAGDVLANLAGVCTGLLVALAVSRIVTRRAASNELTQDSLYIL